MDGMKRPRVRMQWLPVLALLLTLPAFLQGAAGQGGASKPPDGKAKAPRQGVIEGESGVKQELPTYEIERGDKKRKDGIGTNQPFPVATPIIGGAMNISTGSTDFAGEYYIIDEEEREPGNFTGVPFNEAGRMRAAAHNPNEWGVEEFQCRPHPLITQWRASGAIRIQKEIDPVARQLVAYHVAYVRGMDRPIYLDGRPHPPAWAPHTWTGFSTGRFVGNVLEITTTHLKEGYFDWNGHDHSAQVKVTEWWMRHGDHLTVTVLHEDPIYLTEPFIQSISYRWDPHTELEYFPCTTITENPTGRIPHWLPGQNPYLSDYATRFGMPVEAAGGFAETMYPEYYDKLQALKSKGSH